MCGFEKLYSYYNNILHCTLKGCEKGTKHLNRCQNGPLLRKKEKKISGLPWGANKNGEKTLPCVRIRH